MFEAAKDDYQLLIICQDKSSISGFTLHVSMSESKLWNKSSLFISSMGFRFGLRCM